MRSIARIGSIAVLAAVLLGAAKPIDGVLALQGATSHVRAYLRNAVLAGPRSQRLDIWMTAPGASTPIRAYDVDLTKRMHLVAIGDDFSTFMHVHPALQADGHFTIDQRFPHDGRYHLYADAMPAKLGHVVFRFDLPVGARTAKTAVNLRPTGPSVTTGGYVVSLNTTRIVAGAMTMLTVHIRERGKPARDLHPYLGALAHAVFIDAADLSYVHTHPLPLSAMGGSSDEMKMPGMKMSGTNMPGMSMPMDEPDSLPDGASIPPDMMLHVSVEKPGAYKLWFQFRGADGLHVAPFVITAARG